MTDTNQSDGDRSDEPFGDLLDRLDGAHSASDGESQGTPSNEAAVEAEEIFSEETYDAVDTDELWDDLESRRAEEESAKANSTESSQDDTDVVPKRAFCQSCRFVTEPPEFHCTHDGTEIVEFVDTEHVRVRNCPIVAERRAESEESL